MSSLRDQVLASVPEAAREGILKMALDQNITDPSDPQWGMVALAWSATESAGLARASLEEVRAAIAMIQDMIYKQTSAAGKDAAEVIKKETLESAAVLGKALTTASKEAAGRLAKAAAEQGPDIIEEWKWELARTVRAQTNKSSAMFAVAGAALAILCVGLGILLVKGFPTFFGLQLL